MVKLTRNYLIKNADNLKLMHIRNRNESEDDYLAKVTHMKLNDKYLEKIEPIQGCHNVTTLYFQNNLLGVMENFNCFPNLTHLYLQRNKISKIENLQELKNLRKIYLGYNEISVLEGFENLPSLKEIHIEFQHLPLGESLYFDPRTLTHLSKHLEVLNVAGNSLISLYPLMNMTNLRELMVEENCVTDLGQLLIVLSTLPNLERLNMTKNPVGSLREFKDAVILSAKKLKNLDGKEVNARTREFLEGWMRARRSRERFQGIRGSGDENRILHAPSERIVHFTEFLTPPNKDKESSNRHPAWQLRPNMNGTGGLYVPRAYRSKIKACQEDVS